MTQKEIEERKRNKIKREKPLVYEKMLQIVDREKRGELVCRIDVGFNYACNLKCLHCMADKFEKKERSLTVEDMHNIAEQADALGWCQFNLSGGEPLILKNFNELLKACMPDKFHIGISTNGYYLTLDRAKELKSLGLDKVMISLDSMDAELHNGNRDDKDAYDKAIMAIWNAKEADLDVVIQHVITHQNCISTNTVKLAEFAQTHDFSLDLVLGKALGEWEGKHEILIDRFDADFLWRLHQRYPAARRDTFPAFGRGGGCGALKKCFHITQYGDVLICVFMHISIGNIFQDSLKTIVERGMSIKQIRKPSAICLAGEDREFINRYMAKFYGKPLPVPYTEIFNDEDILPVE